MEWTINVWFDIVDWFGTYKTLLKWYNLFSMLYVYYKLDLR